jgi:hypothetical protein
LSAESSFLTPIAEVKTNGKVVPELDFSSPAALKQLIPPVPFPVSVLLDYEPDPKDAVSPRTVRLTARALNADVEFFSLQLYLPPADKPSLAGCVIQHSGTYGPAKVKDALQARGVGADVNLDRDGALTGGQWTAKRLIAAVLNLGFDGYVFHELKNGAHKFFEMNYQGPFSNDNGHFIARRPAAGPTRVQSEAPEEAPVVRELKKIHRDLYGEDLQASVFDADLWRAAKQKAAAGDAAAQEAVERMLAHVDRLASRKVAGQRFIVFILGRPDNVDAARQVVISRGIVKERDLMPVTGAEKNIYAQAIAKVWQPARPGPARALARIKNRPSLTWMLLLILTLGIVRGPLGAQTAGAPQTPASAAQTTLLVKQLSDPKDDIRRQAIREILPAATTAVALTATLAVPWRRVFLSVGLRGARPSDADISAYDSVADAILRRLSGAEMNLDLEGRGPLVQDTEFLKTLKARLTASEGNEGRVLSALLADGRPVAIDISNWSTKRARIESSLAHVARALAQNPASRSRLMLVNRGEDADIEPAALERANALLEGAGAERRFDSVVSRASVGSGIFSKGGDVFIKNLMAFLGLPQGAVLMVFTDDGGKWDAAGALADILTFLSENWVFRASQKMSDDLRRLVLELQQA